MILNTAWFSSSFLIYSGFRILILREGPRSQGASWGVCGSGVPPYEFLNLYGVSHSRFSISFFPEKRLELKSLKRQTKAEELGAPCPELLSLRLSLKAL
jgi:hypothetical protein